MDIRDLGAQVTALFRRHQNNSRKLEHRSNKLNNDAREEWPERFMDRFAPKNDHHAGKTGQRDRDLRRNPKSFARFDR